ncbi:MAG: FtsX-like permease family protein [Lachnospiraceae bacterium]|nr:FtsX-like permease family protein [Lachnospiraceae bacterium]
MKAGILCGRAKLKRRKFSNLLLGSCILITAALLVNALVFLQELDTIFDRAYEGMKGAQMCCLWNKEVVSGEEVRQYMERSSEGLSYQITENTKTIDYIEKDGVKLSNGILLELPETISKAKESQEILPDGECLLSPGNLDGSEWEMPGRDEIWITDKIANVLNLKVGDTVSLQFADASVKVRVAKIAVDPVFGGSSTNIYRMWCGYGRISQFPLAENNGASYLEIRFGQYSPKAEQEFIRRTEEHFQMPLGDTVYTYGQIKGGYTSIYQMAGAVMCLVSLILSATVVLLSLFLVKSDMDEEVRYIGVCKSLGMGSGQIIGGYLACYGCIGAAGGALGSMAGVWLNRGIIRKILGDMGIKEVSFTGTERYPFLACFLVAAVVLLACFGPIFKIWKLNPSDAVRRSAWKEDRKGRKERTDTYDKGCRSFELYYALRRMQDKKIRHLYLAGMSLIFGGLATVCVGCLNSVRNIDEDPETWGFIRTDIYVSSLEDTPVSAVIGELGEDPRVDYTYGVNKVYPKYQPGKGESWRSMVAELYELPWNEKVKDKSLFGRRPQKENEIGIGMALAEEYGLQIRETMELFINGEKKEYEITGIFQTLSNSGKVIRMVTDDLDSFVKGEKKSGDYMLVLKAGTDKWEYAEELNEKYGGRFTFIASKSNGENISGILAPIAGTVLGLLLVTVVLVTTNLTFLLVRQERKLIGLLKAVGMTSREILKIYLWQNCLPAVVGTVLGFLAGTYIMPGALGAYAKEFGLTEFPFVNSLEGVSVGILLLPACMFAGTWVVVRMIHRVSVKELVSE